MLKDMLIEMAGCRRCSFADKNHPPLTPVRLADRTTVMFIGENPSWEFGQRVPFDGITNSGRALHDNYLIPLKKAFNLTESDFWITDLFKCRYPKEVYREKRSSQELIFANANTCATTWLAEEIRLTQPKVIVTLGDKEVYQRIRTMFGWTCPSDFYAAAYKLHSVALEGYQGKLLPACHPDISFNNSRKPLPSRKWSILHRADFVRSLNSTLKPGRT